MSVKKIVRKFRITLFSLIGIFVLFLVRLLLGNSHLDLKKVNDGVKDLTQKTDSLINIAMADSPGDGGVPGDSDDGGGDCSSGGCDGGSGDY
jgi:hypothetical protein